MAVDLNNRNRIARAHHGLFRFADAQRCGLSRDDLRELVARHWCDRPGRTVYRVVGAPETSAQATLAAVWFCGDDAVASHRAAANTRGGVPGYGQSRPEVTKPRGQSQRRRYGLIHGSLWLPGAHHRRQRDQGRLRRRPPVDPRPRRPHPASLTDVEKDLIVDMLCSERFCDLAPAQVYSTLLDEGTYLCSERQMYRVLAERGLVRERRRGGHQCAGSYGVPRLEADAPNKVWTWDITALRGPTKGVKYYLYTIIDIYSRKVVAWSIHEAESETHARRLIGEACRRHQVDRDQLVIHADRGSPMIAGTVAELLNELGVTKSPRPCTNSDW